MFDLSEGGMAIRTDKPLGIGTELDITFHVIFRDRQSPPMEAKARVIHCIPIPEKKLFRTGIEFSKILPEDKKEIAALVRSKPGKK
ncbi:MAG: PilZ domain-containing protein [Candidatus Omnitrophica bacterium]|nr:PilZ domain-containing protein [Candidatus Omnitrophota bacterium]